jgi:RNA polymerase sigma-70 factor (ECF subfamily)
MFEGRQLAGEAILSGASAIGRENVERSQDEVIEALVRAHSRLVYRIAFAVLRRHHDAEDSVQETFVRVWRYRSKLDAVEDAKTWLARIAWRVAVDRWRKRGGSNEIAIDHSDKPAIDVIAPGASAHETMLSLQAEAKLERLIASLPTKLREPLILSTVEEMSPKEVSATLGINEAAVRSRVFRARQILREKLATQLAGKGIGHKVGRE